MMSDDVTASTQARLRPRKHPSEHVEKKPGVVKTPPKKKTTNPKKSVPSKPSLEKGRKTTPTAHSYFAKRGTVQYAFHISPTPRFYSPHGSHSNEETPGCDKKPKMKRKGKKGKGTSTVFEFCSDEEDEEETHIPPKRIKIADTQQQIPMTKSTSNKNPIIGEKSLTHKGGLEKTKKVLVKVTPIKTNTVSQSKKTQITPPKPAPRKRGRPPKETPTTKPTPKKTNPGKVTSVKKSVPPKDPTPKESQKKGVKRKTKEDIQIDRPSTKKGKITLTKKLSASPAVRRSLRTRSSYTQQTNEEDSEEQEVSETVAKESKKPIDIETAKGLPQPVDTKSPKESTEPEDTGLTKELGHHIDTNTKPLGDDEPLGVDNLVPDANVHNEKENKIDTIEDNIEDNKQMMEVDIEPLHDPDAVSSKVQDLCEHHSLCDANDNDNTSLNESFTTPLQQDHTPPMVKTPLNDFDDEMSADMEKDDNAAMETELPLETNTEKSGRPSLESVADLSLSETEIEFKRQSFDRHLKPSKPQVIPSLCRSSTWPKTMSTLTFSQTATTKLAQSVTIVRNVRQAHECLERGENLQFRDEVEYLLDNMRPDQPLSVRCLSTLNLAQECLKTDFIRQVRGHGLTNNILLLLKDTLDHPALQVAMATLFFVMTRDKMDSSELDRKCVELLLGLMSVDDKGNEKDTMEGKAARELERISTKSRAILARCSPLLLRDKDQDKARGGVDDESEEAMTVENALPTLPPTDLNLAELVSECFVSLTAAQTSCHWLREEMRILGVIDHIANRVILLTDNSIKHLSIAKQEQLDDEGDNNNELEGYLMKLIRQLKLLENVSFLNKGNQGYLTIFDGSILISKLCCLLVSLQTALENKEESQLKSVLLECLLGALRVFLNITHDHELGSYRIGEQPDIVETILAYIFKLSLTVPLDRQFDLLVLSLGLLINLVEHSAPNRQQLYTIHTQCQDGEQLYSNVLAVNAIIKLFLTHYKRAEDVTIDVPTPQRLSQMSPQSSPMKGSPKIKRDLSASSFALRMKTQKTVKGFRSPVKLSNQQDDKNMEWFLGLNEENTRGDTEVEDDIDVDDDEEEEIEDGAVSDPLVFSREDFDSALTQAGQHMEDSIISSYSALLLAVLAKHNSEFASTLKSELPDGNYSSLIKVLKEFISFMNMASSSTTRSGLESIRKILKHLESSD